MKKILTVITAVVSACCTVCLFSCGEKKPSAKIVPDGSLDKCTLRFSWWGGDDRHEATLNAIRLWNSIHPEIEVKAEYGGWDGWTEKVNAQISGGTEPDVMQINYDWLVSISPDGKGFYDLYKIGDRLDLSGFDPETLSFGEVEGHLNAVTVSVSGRCLYYNSEVFRRLGASYPDTWDSLLELGRNFSSYGLYPLDLDIQSGGTAWYLSSVYVQQKTGRQFITMDGKLGFTEQDIKSALDFYKMLEENHVIRTVKTRTDEDGNCALYQSAEFIDGNIAGVLEWGSAVGKYEGVLDKGVLETGGLLSDGNGNSTGWLVKPVLMYAVSANTSHPDEAGAFLDFLLNNAECAEILGTTRGIPASGYARESLEKTDGLSLLVQETDRLLRQADTMTVSPYAELPKVKAYCNTAIENVSYNIEDTETSAHELYESVKEYLEKFE